MTAGSALEPYVRQSNDIATADSAQLIDPKQKELSNTLRSIETAKTKVSPLLLLFFFALCNEENFSHKRLMWRQQSVLGCAAPVRAFIFIVTLSIYLKHLLFNIIAQ